MKRIHSIFCSLCGDVSSVYGTFKHDVACVCVLRVSSRPSLTRAVLSPQAASLPMSIIIVGVGPAEFDGKSVCVCLCLIGSVKRECIHGFSFLLPLALQHCRSRSATRANVSHSKLPLRRHGLPQFTPPPRPPNRSHACSVNQCSRLFGYSPRRLC